VIALPEKFLFLFLRHGLTEGNKERIYRSWSNAPKAQLSKEGRQGVMQSANYLRAHEVPIEMIVCDSLDRTFETAEIVASFLETEKIIPIRRLHPLNMGDWTLQPKDEHPAEDLWKDLDKAPPNGESLRQFNSRQLAVFKNIFEIVDGMPEDARLLIVAHGSNLAFLHNRVFNKNEDRVEYEGLVEPAGLVAATVDGLLPLTNVREKE
jgi:broad specificity phosphatase PhoE